MERRRELYSNPIPNSAVALSIAVLIRLITFTLGEAQPEVRGFYPKRPPGQDVATGASPPPLPPRYAPSFSSRIGVSIPTFQFFMLVDFHRNLVDRAGAYRYYCTAVYLSHQHQAAEAAAGT